MGVPFALPYSPSLMPSVAGRAPCRKPSHRSTRPSGWLVLPATLAVGARLGDASPPCSGHDGLMSGLGDRKLNGPTQPARAEEQLLSVGAERGKRAVDGQPRVPLPPGKVPAPDTVKSGPWSRSLSATDCLLPLLLRMRSWPPGRRNPNSCASVLVLRSYVKGVLSRLCGAARTMSAA